MEVRFEDHPQFQRAAAAAALGGTFLAAAAPHQALLPAATAGGAFALALWPGLPAEARSRRLALAIVSSLAGAAALLGVEAFWLVLLSGALLGLLFAAARADSAQEGGAQPPSLATVAASAALTAAAAFLARAFLPGLQEALAGAVPGFLAAGAAGLSFALWAALAAAPLHLAVGADPVETRLAELRPSLPAEVRLLAERAAAARRGAAADLPHGERSDLRSLLDSLALAALDLAGRTATLSRTATPALEEDLLRRTAQLQKSAGQCEDPAAQQSYLRAAEALEGQLDHLRRVRRARERALARLHEEVANLERARFALTLLLGADREQGAHELDLLHERLQHRTLFCELNDDDSNPRQTMQVSEA